MEDELLKTIRLKTETMKEALRIRPEMTMKEYRVFLDGYNAGLKYAQNRTLGLEKDEAPLGENPYINEGL